MGGGGVELPLSTLQESHSGHLNKTTSKYKSTQRALTSTEAQGLGSRYNFKVSFKRLIEAGINVTYIKTSVKILELQ